MNRLLGVMTGASVGVMTISDDFASFIICLRDIQGGDDTYLGPYRSNEKAQRVAARLNRDIAARGASHMLDAIVEGVVASTSIEEFRQGLLDDMEDMGYAFIPPALRVACPLCGAAPTERCQYLRVAENARSGRTEYGNYGPPRYIKWTHRERTYAAKQASS